MAWWSINSFSDSVLPPERSSIGSERAVCIALTVAGRWMAAVLARGPTAAVVEPAAAKKSSE
jgi:hypothetical protein